MVGLEQVLLLLKVGTVATGPGPAGARASRRQVDCPSRLQIHVRVSTSDSTVQFHETPDAGLALSFQLPL